MNKKDPSNFRQFILDTPNQFKIGFELAKDKKVKGKYDNACVSGMGGSALPVNLLQSYLNIVSKNPINIYINRDYKLPIQAKRSGTLNFISSYSGNTEESISSLEEVKKLNKSFIGFSSGGKIEELSKKYKMPHIKLPIPFPNYQPRMGTGYFFSSMLQILINHGLVEDTSKDILKSVKTFDKFVVNYEKEGKRLAKKIKGKTPVIYTASSLSPVAMVWKIKINENSKTPAFWNYFPELNHNEMVGFTNPQAKFFIFMLRDKDDHPRNKKRYDVTAKLLKEKGVESEIIDMDGNDTFSKMFLSISLVDWISYYLALEYNQDPTPVDMVESLKKILA